MRKHERQYRPRGRAWSSESGRRAARRVRAKFGTDDTGTPLDWTEWRAVDKACNAIDRIAANNSITGGGTPYRECTGSEVK